MADSLSSSDERHLMRTDTHNTVQLGELVVAVFDSAAEHSTDPREVSRLATEAVVGLLRRAQETSPSARRLPSLERTVETLIAERPRG
jgi:hypothetical protein